MLPSLASSMAARTALAMRKVPVRFTSRIFCQRSSGMSAVWEKAPMPATLQRTLTRPRVAATRAAVSFTADSSETSQR